MIIRTAIKNDLDQIAAVEAEYPNWQAQGVKRQSNLNLKRSLT